MNELQNVQFNILKAFVDVCEKLGLRYYLVCGTALGAVKYGGFIPWDDDVDAALTRKDYETFCEKAPELLPEYYFVQNRRSDPYFDSIYTKLRDVRTTFVEKGSESIDMVHGVYIDVFPLDGHPDGGFRSAVFEARKRILVLGLSSKFRHDSAAKDILFAPMRAFSAIFRKFSYAARYEKLITSCPPESSALWCNYGNSKLKVEYAPREQYGEGIEAKFEGLAVRVPSDSDAYLTQKYGNWRADPPKEAQIGHHDSVVCDLERPYTEYITKTKRGKISVSTAQKR